MTFQDLPDNWDTLPLTDPRIATDAVDLFLGDKDRSLNTMLVLLCDDDLRPIQPVLVDGVQWRCSALARRQTLGFLPHLPVGGVVLAISSPQLIPLDVAQRWRRTVEAICDEGGPVLMHFFSASPGVLPTHVGRSILLTGP